MPDQGEGEQKRKATDDIQLSSPLSLPRHPRLCALELHGPRQGEGGWGGEVCGKLTAFLVALVNVVAAASLAGCASSGSLSEPSALDAATARRRPDGVAIDPISAPPAARDRASTTEGLVTLRTPLGADRAIAAVEELFHKIVIEDGEGLEALFTRDATAVTGAAPTGSPQPPSAVLLWQGRFRKLDYTRLAGEPIYRGAELQIFRADDTVERLPHPAVHPEALGEGDVVVRVPILITRVGADRLFGDEVVLWMRRDGDRYRIYRILEDFQLN